MSLLKILPNAIDTTLSYTFGNVSATSVTSNGVDLITYVQAAFDKANTGVSTSTDQYARDTANDATSVNTTQNTNISAVDTYATSAYGKANTVGTLAQAAFDKANTGGGGTSSFAITVDTFSGNGSNTSFTLSAVPSSKNETMVHINGVYQNKNTYSVSGSTITFTGVASVSDTIEVETAAGSLMNVAATAYSTRIYNGDGSTNTFTISSGQTANTLFVFNNGICQFPGDDYTISGTTLTYVVTPQADEVVQIREMPVGRVIPTTVPNMRRYTANGVQTVFTVSDGQTANSMFVYENGVCQVPGNDYSVSGTTLTFVTAPTSDKVIQIREMPV